MGKAIIAFILSVGVISIIGAFLIYQNENKKDE